MANGDNIRFNYKFEPVTFSDGGYRQFIISTRPIDCFGAQYFTHYCPVKLNLLPLSYNWINWKGVKLTVHNMLLSVLRVREQY